MEKVIQNGDLTGVKRMVLEDPVVLEACFSGWLKETPLMIAAKRSQVEIAKWLIAQGAKVDSQNPSGYSALMYACEYGQQDIAKLLLESGANLDLERFSGWTALMDACLSGHTEIVRLLVESGANLDLQNFDGSTALMEAAQNGHLAVCKLLLDGGANVNVQSSTGETALMWASREGHEVVVRLLFEYKANLELLRNDGLDVFEIVAKVRRRGVLVLLEFLMFSELSRVLQFELGLPPALALALFDRGLRTLDDCKETLSSSALEEVIAQGCGKVSGEKLKTIVERLLGVVDNSSRRESMPKRLSRTFRKHLS